MKHHIIAAKLCHLSYEKKRGISFPWTSDISNEKEDVQAYSFDSQGLRYITIRGSHSWKDWWRNLQTDMLVTPFEHEGYSGGVRLHTGFYEGYLSIQEKVLALADTDLRLVITGHSQGGSIAEIAGADISFRLDKQAEIITLGAPAVGNEAWSISASSLAESTAYRNKFDIAPALLRQNFHSTKQTHLDVLNFDPHNTKNYYHNIKSYVLNNHKYSRSS